MRRGAPIVALLCVLSCAQSAPPLPDLDAKIESIRSDESIPGLAVAIIRDGELIHDGAYGWSDASEAQVVTSETTFELGSIKKVVTAVAMLRLAERGALELDDPLQRWIPSFPYPQLTLRQMMHQVSGLPDEVGDDPIVLEFEPGSDWAYRNSNFDLLDQVLLAADGSSLPQLIDEELTAPFDLKTPRKCRADESCWMEGRAVELARWVDLLFSGEVICDESVDQLTEPHRFANGMSSGYGLGVDLRPYRGLRRYWHSGHMDEGTAVFAHYPDEALTVVVATNLATLHDPERIEQALTRLLLNLPEPTFERVPLLPGQIDSRLGIYDAGVVWFRLEQAKGGDFSVVMQGPDEGGGEYVHVPLVYVGSDRFVGEKSPETVTVQLLEGGVARFEIVGITWRAQLR